MQGRLGYRLLTSAALTAAAAGVVLPLVPTTPFLLLALWSASRHSPQLAARLLADPRVGPHVLAWRQHRAVSRRAKYSALATLAVSYLVTWWTVPQPAVRLVIGILFVAGGGYLWSRPEPRSRGDGPAGAPPGEGDGP